MPISSTNRQHTIHSVVRDGGKLVGVLEKDWYDTTWCDLFRRHFRVQHGNHIFHVTSDLEWFTLAHAENMVSAVAAGNFSTIDLKEMSINDLLTRRNKSAKRKK